VLDRRCLVVLALLAGVIGLAINAMADDTQIDTNLGYFAKPHYIGSAYCYACHADLSREFARTKMGRLFQLRPENDLERRGCEGCHGPGSNHAIMGGGVSMGGLVEFRIDRGQSIEAANKVCLNCHDEAFWHGHVHGARRLACFDCHLVMTRMSRSAQLAPPYVAPWNNRRTWSRAIAIGLFAGILTGAIFRHRRPAREQGGNVRA
jgi:formate-dependent nitrite reductase cytochrome c552 subunit